VLGYGAAKEGPAHWWSQRVTSVALVFLTLWFLVALLRLDDLGHASVITWLSQPISAVLAILTIVVAVYHSQLGVQVVLEDYLQGGVRLTVLLLLKFLHILIGALGVFAVLRIAFGATP
jgi:succinate dehydrogenase / fumarate reductase, membrane anchor subunit